MSAFNLNPFDDLYASSDDPWHIENRWYERRKRALLLAALTRQRMNLIVEPGCGTGALSSLLAERCERLIACDISPKAVALARHRLRHAPHVEVSCLAVPQAWPELPASMTADCIVISELAYYLDPTSLIRLTDHIAASLASNGTLVACHWQGPFAARTMSSAAIHAQFASRLGLQSICHHAEADFLLDVWSADGVSVAASEGFA